MGIIPTSIILISIMSTTHASPFVYGSTVSNKAFTNREAEVKKLSNNLIQGINTTIISPRRWGKSSLVEKVVNDLNKKGGNRKTIVIDLFSIGSEEEFYEEFARSVLKASSTKWQDWIQSGKTLFKQLIPKISVGIDPSTDFSLSFDWSELQKHKDEILNLPEILAEQNNLQLVVCLDEFQNLTSYKDYEVMEKRMRACWQRHKRVTYCLYGSKRHMMSDIFNKPSKPFYRFGDIIFLPKIKSDKWVGFITKAFKSTGKKISSKNARIIADCMKQHSWYVQQLAHYTWQKTDQIATKEQINSSLVELIAANSPLYQNETERLSGTQLNLIKAIVNGETKLTGTGAMQKYRLGTPRNVSKNKNTLIKNDIIHQTESQFELLDPAFELWFLKQFYNINYTI